MAVDPTSQEPQPASFKVVDRRRFTAAGEVKKGGESALEEDRRRVVPTLASRPQNPDSPRAQSSGTHGSPAHSESQRDASDQGAPQRPQAERRSQVDFMAFVASLATNAMAALGLMADGPSQGMAPNPHLAREYIEIIFMLQERTEGNLTADEAQNLRQLLSDLRLQYVEATRPPAPKTPGH